MSTDAAGSERIIAMQSPCRMLSIGRSAGVAVRCFVAGVFTRSITPMVRPCFHVKEGLDESRRLCRQARDSKESDAGNGERKESPTTYGVARDSGTPPLVVWPGGLSEIGRAACRERGWTEVLISVVAGTLKKK